LWRGLSGPGGPLRELWRSLGGLNTPVDLGLAALAASCAVAVVLALILIPSFRLNLEHPAFGLTDTGGPPGADAPSP